MKLRELSLAELSSRLKNRGLRFSVGIFAVNVQSSISVVAEGLHQLYADYMLLDEADFIDFYMKLDSPSLFRRWYKPQVNFYFDGFTPFKPLPYDQAFAMFEWSFNWCIASQMHNYLVIHAAVLEKNNKTVIMPAPPGSGKSTLCASLAMSGWRLLSDELAIVDLNGGSVYPFTRPINLKNDSIDLVKKTFTNAVFGPVARDTVKGTVSHLKPLESCVNLAAQKAAPAWIIFPLYKPNSKPVLVPISQSESFMKVAENSFNYSELGHQGFQALGHLVDLTECYSFEYSEFQDALDTFNMLAETE